MVKIAIASQCDGCKQDATVDVDFQAKNDGSGRGEGTYECSACKRLNRVDMDKEMYESAVRSKQKRIGAGFLCAFCCMAAVAGGTAGTQDKMHDDLAMDSH
eukprot:TRINITY_DN760_c0_g1_i2.p2 TRINITY_DN760_c0_g1~~TRINITY_DN760_c0_g1_i2.p2  ORF type:complete len:101 (+),score=29.24 TRINITY_DN760_c0_g1_i2:597-899(+)